MYDSNSTLEAHLAQVLAQMAEEMRGLHSSSLTGGERTARMHRDLQTLLPLVALLEKGGPEGQTIADRLRQVLELVAEALAAMETRIQTTETELALATDRISDVTGETRTLLSDLRKQVAEQDRKLDLILELMGEPT